MKVKAALNRISAEQRKWNDREARFKEIFSSYPKATQSRAFQIEKLKFYEEIVQKYRNTPDLDERLAVRFLAEQTTNLEKNLYPSKMIRFLRGTFNIVDNLIKLAKEVVQLNTRVDQQRKQGTPVGKILIRAGLGSEQDQRHLIIDDKINRFHISAKSETNTQSEKLEIPLTAGYLKKQFADLQKFIDSTTPLDKLMIELLVGKPGTIILNIGGKLQHFDVMFDKKTGLNLQDQFKQILTPQQILMRQRDGKVLKTKLTIPEQVEMTFTKSKPKAKAIQKSPTVNLTQRKRSRGVA